MMHSVPVLDASHLPSCCLRLTCENMKTVMAKAMTVFILVAKGFIGYPSALKF